MTSSLKTAFNPDMIDTLRRGIDSRDVASVKTALEHGLDPNVYTYSGALPLTHPLLFVSYHQSGLENVMDAATFNKNSSAIIELMLDHGLKVAAPHSRHEAENCRYLIDHYLFSDRLADVSRLVVRALCETTAEYLGDSYEMFPIAQARRYLNSAKPSNEAEARTLINESLRRLEMLHATVRARLLNPSSKEEKALVEKNREKISYWLQPLQAPSAAAIMHHLFAPKQTPVSPAAANDIKSGGPLTQVDKSNKDAAPPKAQKSGDEDAQAAANLVDVMTKRDPAEIMAEIESEFIGLDAAKEALYDVLVGELYDAACTVQDVAPTPERHSAVFLGNPGLGKTTFARKYAELLHAVGATGPNYIEIGPGNAVGKYIGATEAKIEAILSTADVLFIDEAYDLISGGSNTSNTSDFGKKVLTAVLRAIENNPKMVVIMAGYSEEMNRMISSNVGLSSRITKHINFEDMDRAQLGKVLDLMAAQRQFTIDPAARAHMLDQVEQSRSVLGPREFGNARLVRNLVDKFRTTLGRRYFAEAAKPAVGKDAANMALLAAPGISELRHFTLTDAKALNYAMALGTSSKKKASADVAPNHPDFEPTVGFGRPLRQSASA